MNERAPQPAHIVRKASAWRWPGIWIVPVVALVIALYLGWRSYSERGPETLGDLVEGYVEHCRLHGGSWAQVGSARRL